MNRLRPWDLRAYSGASGASGSMGGGGAGLNKSLGLKALCCRGLGASGFRASGV